MNVSEILEGLNANESRLLLALASKGKPTSPEEIFSAGAFDEHGIGFAFDLLVSTCLRIALYTFWQSSAIGGSAAAGRR